MLSASQPYIETVDPLPMLVDLDPQTQDRLRVFLRETRVAPGIPLLTQGESNDRLWFVVSGSVAIERGGPGKRPEVLATLAAPSVFGTTTFYRPETPASATIRAVDELHLWTLDRGSEDQLRHEDPRLAETLNRAIIRILSERFDTLDGRLTRLLTEHDRDRTHPVASELAAFRTRLFEEPGL